MSEHLISWFHCGRCASLFKSVAGEQDRHCTVCGEDPSLGLESENTAVGRTIQKGEPLLRVKMAEVEKPKVFKREVRREKTRYFALKLLVGWAAVMGLLVLLAHFLWNSKQHDEQRVYTDESLQGSLADEDTSLLSKEYPETLKTMSGFLNARTPEEKNQFVRAPVETASRMARYYQMNSISNVEPETVKGTGAGVIHLPDGRKVIESRFSTNDGREIDGVFFKEKGEWRLDWEDYARYCDEPLALFFAEGGAGEGEFRVYARERLAEQRSEISKLRIALHAPRFGHPDSPGEASPEFQLDQESEAGRMIKEALASRQAGKRILGSTLDNHDPEGMIRVHVKIRRIENPTGREFSIDKVIACHWLSIEDPGVRR